ncbi:MAG: HEAT repeat domain-containing protein [Spirochaetaceae bacterium]|nr:MAG: HEAT repeat domain-containing protein [Spirochaetaceae bacterium]
MNLGSSGALYGLACTVLLLCGSPMVAPLFAESLPNPESGEPERPAWVIPGDDAGEPNGTGQDPIWVPITPRDIPMTPQRMTEIRVLEYGARAEDPNQKLAAVRRIDTLHRQGALDPRDRVIIGILHFLATEGTGTRTVEGGRRIASFPHVRMQAVRTLGNVGGPYARTAVLEVIRNDSEPMVLGEATAALSRMNAETDAELIGHLTLIIERMGRTGGSDYLAYATLRAIEELHWASAGLHDPALFRAVLTLTQAPYSAAVQRKAFRVVDLLRGR